MEVIFSSRMFYHGLINGVFKRATVTVNMDPPIIGVGDNPERKQAERLAALSAVYQLHNVGLVRCSSFITAFTYRSS